MSSAIAKTNDAPLAVSDDSILQDEALWDIVSSGDLKGLDPQQRSQYYLYRCRQEGLNPASQPFTYLTLNGKGVLYANKSAADQLRKLHGISITNVDCRDDGDYIECDVRVRDREGREDFETASVFVGTAKGDQRANAKMKCLTKAKRRATYSICGTGVLDETEIETIPRFTGSLPDDKHMQPGGVAYEGALSAGDGNEAVDAETGEIPETVDDVKRDIRKLARKYELKTPDMSKIAKDLGLPAWDDLSLQQARQYRMELVARAEGVDPYQWAQEADGGNTLIDAEYRPAGEAGDDRYTAA